jgi:hypothetical protein
LKEKAAAHRGLFFARNAGGLAAGVFENGAILTTAARAPAAETAGVTAGDHMW